MVASIEELLACDPVDVAERIAAHWREVESAHDARRALADYLVNRLSGKKMQGPDHEEQEKHVQDQQVQQHCTLKEFLIYLSVR